MVACEFHGDGTIRRNVAFTAVMELADHVHASAHADFHDVALPWLKHVARYARLLTQNQPDADDLAQDTFLRAFQAWHTFRPGSDCRKWLFTICRHAFLRDRQRGSRFVAVEDPDAEVHAATDLYDQIVASGIQHLFDRIDVAPALERGLGELPSEYREAILFVDVEGYSYADTARALDVPIGTVRSRLYRARRILQQTLIEHARDMGFVLVAVSADGEEHHE